MRSYISKNRIELSNHDTSLPKFVATLGWTAVHSALPLHPNHVHANAYEICYIEKGKVIWQVENEQYELNRGKLFITAPGEVHGGRNMLLHPCEVFWLQVLMNEFSATVGPAFSMISATFARITSRHFAASPEVSSLFHRIIKECRQPSCLSETLIICQLTSLLANITHDYLDIIKEKSTKTDEQNRKIQVAADWMETNLHHDFPVEQAAEISGFKPSRFHQLFIRHTGFTPLEFINRKRIETARLHLATSRKSVTQIAFATGFRSSQYFATVFKKYIGMSPTQFRRTNRNG